MCATGRSHADTLRLEVLSCLGRVDRDGIERADVLVHGAIDLFALAETPVPDAARADAFERLRRYPPGPERTGLAARLGVALPDDA